MALSINPPNLSGLSGGQYGNLNLPVPGSLGLQALQTGQQGALEKMKLQQAGQLGLLQNNLQRQQLNQQFALGQQQNALDQQKLMQLQAMEQARMANEARHQERAYGLDERKLNMLEQQSAKEAQQKQLAALLELDRNSIKEKGAFASYGLLAMKQAKTPEEANLIRQQIVSEAVSKGHINEAEGKASLKMPLSQFNNSLMYQVMQFGAVKNFKDMMDATKEEAPKTGTHVSFNPDGSIKEIVSDPTTPVKTEVQKELLDREEALQKLAPIRQDFKEKYFTLKNQAAIGASKFAEKAKGIPGLEQVSEITAATLTGGKSPEERAEDIKAATKYLNAIEQFFHLDYRKPVTGAAAAQKELQDLRSSFLNNQMSPSEFLGALDGVLERYTSETEFKRNVLKEGINTTGNADLKSFLKAKGYSDQEISEALSKRGL